MPTLVEIAGSIQPIIDTFKADDLRERPNQVRTRYELNAGRYCPTQAMERVRDNLLRTLGRGERALGYLFGHYGHGKTAAAVYLWKACEDAGLVAVPPFQFTSFDDMVAATGGWLRHAIHARDAQQAKNVNTLEGRYRTRSVEQRALDLVRRHKVELQTARRIVEESIAPDVSIGEVAHAADFLEEAARLAKMVGFGGLVVFADEMQLFIQQGDVRENVEDLRRLVLALRASLEPVGLMVVMQEHVGQMVAEQAGDAVQRMEDAGASLRLGDHLDAVFPRRVLEYLCKQAGVDRKMVADDASLEALGQISLRRDLSNGPRTVAAAMRAIARHYGADPSHPYTVWDLMADYERREIVFEGQEVSLSGVLAQLLGDDVVRTDARYGQVIRFVCAFPEGTPPEHLKHYGLHIATEELAVRRGLLGTALYMPRANHYAARALQVNPSGEDRITEIVRLFRDRWLYHTPPGLRIAVARQAFATLVLPELFPRRGPGDAGRRFAGHVPWPGETSRDPEEIALVGTFEATQTAYPERRIAVAVGTGEDGLLGWRPASEDTHLAVTFRLHPAGETTPQRVITTAREPRLDFDLNLDVSVGEDFPPELQLLRDSMIPRMCTALVLLNLLFYLEDMLQAKMQMSEADRQQVRHNLMGSARRNVLSMLFPARTESVGVTPRGTGRNLIEGVVAQKLRELFPGYRPLQTGAEARVDLARYERLLTDGGFMLAVKRGLEPVRLAVDEFVARAGVSSASQFNTLAQRLKALGLLVTGHEETLDRRRSLEFTFTEHPLEVRLREEVEKAGKIHTLRRGGRDRDTRRMLRAPLGQIARRLGYLDSEFALALTLAGWRQQLESDEEYVWLAVPDTDPDTLGREANELAAEIACLSTLYPADAAELTLRLEPERERIPIAPPDTLSDLAIELRLVAESLREKVRARTRELEVARQHSEARLRDLLRALPESRLENALPVSGPVGGKLQDVRARLLRQSRALRADLERLAGQMRPGMGVTGAVSDLKALHRQATVRNEGLRAAEEGLAELQRAEGLLERWCALALTARRFDADIGDRHPDLKARLAEWSDDALDAFNRDLLAALEEQERMQPPLSALQAALASRAQQQRRDFEQFAETLRRLLADSGIAPPRPPLFDPQEADRAWMQIAEDAAACAACAAGSEVTRLNDLSGRCSYLHAFRQKSMAAEETRIRVALSELGTAVPQLTAEVADKLRHGEGSFPAALGTVARAREEADALETRLSALERADAPEPGLPHQALGKVRETTQNGQGVSLAALFRDLSENRTITADELFDALHSLYVRGNIEIVIRNR